MFDVFQKLGNIVLSEREQLVGNLRFFDFHFFHNNGLVKEGFQVDLDQNPADAHDMGLAVIFRVGNGQIADFHFAFGQSQTKTAEVNLGAGNLAAVFVDNGFDNVFGRRGLKIDNGADDGENKCKNGKFFHESPRFQYRSLCFIYK